MSFGLPHFRTKENTFFSFLLDALHLVGAVWECLKLQHEEYELMLWLDNHGITREFITVIEKGIILNTVFQPLLNCIKKVHSPRILAYQEAKSPGGCAVFVTLCRNIFPFLKLNRYFFVLINHMYSIHLGRLIAMSVFCAEWTRFFCCCTKWVNASQLL